ncbi:MBG domain-containing protein [Pontibacter locisalis]|uniref:MBG domain-containing protein n=1 Tax=Pontibacter locisalis TaxID=1719035 RepID=A0ABW5INL6_9BACT
MTNYIRRSSVLLGLLTWLALCYHGSVVQAQDIIKLEYYIDDDPGFGNGQSIAIIPGVDITKTFPVDIASQPAGFHNLYVRALVKQHQVTEGDATATKGGWSITAVRTFYKESFNGTPTLSNIVKGEFFIDNDPGFGQGTNITLSPGPDLNNLAFSFDITQLPIGFHNLYVRFKDANKNWGKTSVRTFYKENLSNNTASTANIVKGEYFIDSDPGFGNGTNIAITPGANLSNLAFTADISNVPAGFHQLYTRFKDANGNWGQTTVRSIYKEVFSAKDPLPNLVKAEYFVDTDPGYGKGKNIPVSPNTELSNLNFALDMADVSIGNHKLYVRVLDAKGSWSLVNVSGFEVESPQELYVLVGTITDQLCAGESVEVPYTVNAPFGSNNVFTAELSDAAGNFTNPVAIGSLTSSVAGTINATIPETAAAGTGYRIRVVANSPTHTSTPNSTNLTIKRLAVLSGISGAQSTCTGLQDYSVSSETGVTYAWNLSGGGTLTSLGNTASVTWTTAGTHTITVTPTNSCGEGDVRTLYVTVYDKAPSLTPVITASGRWMYASAAPLGSGVSEYQWYLNGAIIVSANSSSFYATENGNYTVRYKNSCGVGPESNVISYSGSKLNQTITFEQLQDKTYGDAPFTLSATASSGLPVSFNVMSGPATIAGNTLTITGAGTVIVRASQAGDENYNAATPVDNSFMVNPLPATVALSNLSQTYNGQPRPITVTTAPTGLSTSVTYGGSSTVPVNAGSYAVVATITDPNYTGSSTGTLVVDKASQSITLESVVTKTYGDAPFQVLASASSGLPVGLSISAVPEGIASISGNTITILGAGTVTVTAKQAGDANYLAAADVSTTFTVNKADQTINFAALQDKTYGDPPFTLSATASSGLTVGFSVVSGPATISGNALTMTGTGTVVVRASQPGDENHNAATPVERSFQVTSPDKVAQSITFAAITDKTYGDAPFELSATASSGLPVSFRVVTGQASISGRILTILGAGAVTVEATQAGDNTYDAAAPVSRSFTVEKATPTITWANPADISYGTALSATQLNATASVPGSFAYSPAAGTVLNAGSDQLLSVIFTPQQPENYNNASANVRIIVNPAPMAFQLEGLEQVYNGQPRIVTVSTTPANVPYNLTYGGTAEAPVNAGTYAVAVSAIDPNYVGSATGTLTVDKAQQTLTLATIEDKTYGDPPFALSAEASSGLEVKFRVISGPATINGTMLSMTGAGRVEVEYYQEGNANYKPASATFGFNVLQASQSITFNALPNKTYGDAPFELVATASSDLPVAFSVVSGPATISGNMLTMTGPGTVVVRALQGGNENYLAAESVDRSFVVNSPDKQTQIISFVAIADKTYGNAPFQLSASASSGLEVNFRVVSGPASVSGNMLTILGAGSVTVEAMQAGNETYHQATAAQTFTVFKATPGVTWNRPANIAEGTALSSLQLNATATVPGAFTYSPATGTVLAAGNNRELSVDFVPQDAANYNSVFGTKAYITVNGAPVLTVTGETTVKEHEQLTLLSSATDVNGDVVTFNLVGEVPQGMSINAGTGTVTWTPTEAQGPDSYSITVRATDNNTPVLYAEQTLNLTVEEVNAAPLLAGVPAAVTVDELAAYTFTATFSDEDLPANKLTLSLAGAPQGATLNQQGVFAWTPTEAQGPGEYIFKVRLTDDGNPVLSAEQEITINVNEVNQLPVLATIPAQFFTSGDLVSFTATASDADLPAQRLTYSLEPIAGENYPQGAMINSATGAFEWSSVGHAYAEYKFKVRAADPYGASAEQLVSMTVRSGNQAPVLATIGDKTVIAGNALAFIIVATDDGLPAGTLTYSAVGLPRGATLDAASGTFFWSTTGGQVGTYTITLSVSDGSLSASETIKVNVVKKTAGVSPQIKYFTPSSGTVGTEVTIVGKNLVDVHNVRFNGAMASFREVDASTIVAVVPHNATTGKITVNTMNGIVSSKQDFTLLTSEIAGSEPVDLQETKELKATSVETLFASESEKRGNLYVYPNPFVDLATVSFTTEQGGDYTVLLYDSNGKLVRLLGEGTAKPGVVNKVEVNGEGLSKGLYIIRLKTVEGSKSMKLILNR